MAPRLDLRPDHLDIVRNILNEHIPEYEVVAFGSRAMWTAKDYSDLDLAVLGEKPLSLRVSSALAEGFSESDLPFKVDIVEWAKIDEVFQKILRRDGVVLQKPTTNSVLCNSPSLSTPDCKETDSRKKQNRRESTNIVNNSYYPDSSDDRLVFGNCAKLIRQNTDPVELTQLTPYVGLEHIAKEKLQLIGIGKSTDAASTKQLFKKGDILFGKLRPYFRKVVYAEFDGICSTDIWVIRPKEKLNSKFLFYWCSSWDFVNFVNSSTEGTRMPRAIWEVACNHHIPNFTFVEQNAIAHILSSLDEKIELNRRMNKTLEEIAQTLFKSWFVSFDPVRAKMKGIDTGLPKHIEDLFPDKLVDSELGEIPEGWEVASLGNVIELNPKRTLHKKQVAPYLEMANMPTKGHVPDNWSERPFSSGMRFTNGDTLLARITPCLENGKVAYVDFLPSGTVGWGSTEYIVMRPKLSMPNEYAYCLARSRDLREFAVQNITGSSGRQRVPAKVLAQFPLIVPSKDVAEAFGNLVRPLFAQVNGNSLESRTLTTLRDALLPKLIEGEIHLCEAEKLAEVIN